MNGTPLTLGLVGALAAGAALSRRGSRALSPREQAISRFLDALERLAGEKQVVYFGPFQVVGDRKGGVLGKLELRVSGSEVDSGLVVHLGFLGVLKEDRGGGRGRALLQMVCEAADEAGLPVELGVSPVKSYGQSKPPMNKAQLRAFYAKSGFKTRKGMGPDFMRREVGGGLEGEAGGGSESKATKGMGSSTPGVDWRALGERVARWTETNESYDLLDGNSSTAGGTWTAGGCAVLAGALKVLHPSLKIWGLFDGDGNLQHVVASTPEGLVLDAEGAVTPAALLKRWQTRERVKAPASLRPVTKAQIRASQISVGTPGFPERIAKALAAPVGSANGRPPLRVRWRPHTLSSGETWWLFDLPFTGQWKVVPEKGGWQIWSGTKAFTPCPEQVYDTLDAAKRACSRLALARERELRSRA